MHIGKRIRYLRMKNNLSQEKLAKGIISVSHLSNLESGRYSASEETIQFLARRLKVDEAYLLNYSAPNEKLETMFTHLFHTIITEVNEAPNILDSIDLPINCIHQEWTYYYLKGSYYYKVLEIDYAQKIEKDILSYMEIDANNEDIPIYLNQAYYYFKGISAYRNNRLEESYIFFTDLLNYLVSNRIYADIQYNLALISYRLTDYFKAKHHADTGINLYIDLGNLEKLATMHNLLGTVYCDAVMYKDALKELNKAMNFTKALNIGRLRSRILHNRGLVYQRLGEASKALEQFMNAYRLKMNSQSKDILVTSIEIIKCHLTLGQYKEAKQLAKSSSKYMKTEADYHLLTSLKGNIDLHEGNENDFIKKKKDALHYFTSKTLFKYAEGIAKELGDYYFKNKKYKNASIYYKMELNNLYEEKGGEKK